MGAQAVPFQSCHLFTFTVPPKYQFGTKGEFMLDRRGFLGIAPLAPLAFGIFKPEELKQLPKGKYLITCSQKFVRKDTCEALPDALKEIGIKAIVLSVALQKEAILVYKLE